MYQKNIELELRAEISKNKYFKLLNKLKNGAKLISRTKRLSVMYFGQINDYSFDIRVRITNGKPEVAIKKGALHAHDRLETIKSIKMG